MCHSARRVSAWGRPLVTKKVQFLAGLFLVCMCVLMLQIVETRILSVISFYHLAFFAISMAMFGMTAGSLIVYFNPTFFAPERLFANLIWITAAFAVVVVLSTTMLISTVVIDPATGFLLAVLLVGQGDCRAGSALCVRRDGDLPGADA